MNETAITTVEVKPTRGIKRVLLVLLTGADNLSGYPIGRAAGIAFSTVYIALDTLEDAGWITGEFEGQPDGRPRRRLYRLTPEGHSHAFRLLGLECHDDDEVSEEGADPVEQAVNKAFHALDKDDRSPVKRIARNLGMAPADVHAIIYPVSFIGPWEDDQEPDI